MTEREAVFHGELVSADTATRPGPRSLVLWCGNTPPVGTTHALTGRGLQPCETAMTPAAIALNAARARAVIIEVPPELLDARDWASPVIEEALAHGLAVVLTDRSAIETESAHRFSKAVEGLVKHDALRVISMLPFWDEIANWIGRHNAGPPPSVTIRLDGDVPTEPDAVLLLRRAFHDMSAVTLARLVGGKSGAGVWSATPSESDAATRAAPFLVKYNELRKTRGEKSRYSQYANERVSFRLRPPLQADRCVEAQTRGLLVFDFIERAIPFRTALLTYAPAQIIGSLFGHTLAGCLRSAVEVAGHPAAAFARINVLKWSVALDGAAEHARTSRPELPVAVALRAAVEALPAMPHRVATAHGDLHTGNLLVAAGSSDVLLIDFGSIEFGMPVATDPACLEVSVTFAPRDIAPELGDRSAPAADEAWLRAAYRFPLEPFTVPLRHGKDAWLSDAVRAIRAEDRKLEADPVPYAVAVASYLIRFAAYASNGTDADRGLAYELACNLFASVDVVLSSRANVNQPVANSVASAHVPMKNDSRARGDSV